MHPETSMIATILACLVYVFSCYLISTFIPGYLLVFLASTTITLAN